MGAHKDSRMLGLTLDMVGCDAQLEGITFNETAILAFALARHKSTDIARELYNITMEYCLTGREVFGLYPLVEKILWPIVRENIVRQRRPYETEGHSDA